MTEIDRLRAHLRLCEQQLAISWDHAPIGMAIVDGDNRMVKVNAALGRLLGTPVEDLVGRDWSELTHPDDLTIGAAEIAALFAGERSTFAVEKRYLHADGRAVWAQVNVALLRDEDGAPLFRLTQHVDITARKRHEHDLEEAAATERAVAEELRRLDRMKNGFLDAISHEIRTPLTVIRGMAETLQALRPDLDGDLRHRLEDALVGQTQQLSDLLEDLTELKRLTHGRATLEPASIDVAATIRRVASRSAVAARAQLDVPDELMAQVDPSHLELIVENLLSNVEKYAPAGPVTVRATPLTDGGGLRLDIVDQGPGIPAHDHHNVFQPFYRAALNHPRPGTGVGLSLVAGSAALHGGQAWIEASETGTHIVVTLPDRAAGTASGASLAGPEAASVRPPPR